mmetsp:Transcript_38071/g.82819  ORF Transcript_38071/g.82819 Transcript_38071/m.82819 type:complete len:217 (-) Transcript_38071:12-662(-)
MSHRKVGAGVRGKVGPGVGEAVGSAVGRGVGGKVVGKGLGAGVGEGVGRGTGAGVGEGVGRGVGAGVGLGVGMELSVCRKRSQYPSSSIPTESRSSMLSLLCSFAFMTLLLLLTLAAAAGIPLLLPPLLPLIFASMPEYVVSMAVAGRSLNRSTGPPSPFSPRLILSECLALPLLLVLVAVSVDVVAAANIPRPMATRRILYHYSKFQTWLFFFGS